MPLGFVEEVWSQPRSRPRFPWPPDGGFFKGQEIGLASSGRSLSACHCLGEVFDCPPRWLWLGDGRRRGVHGLRIGLTWVVASVVGSGLSLIVVEIPLACLKSSGG